MSPARNSNSASKPGLFARCCGCCSGSSDGAGAELTPLPPDIPAGRGDGDEDKPTPGGGGGGRRPTFPGPVMESPAFNELRRKLLKEGVLYEDPDFRPDSRHLFQGGPTHNVEWKRPKQIVRNPVFFHGGTDYYDFTQGEVGNCWFVSSVACVTASPQKKLINRVVPRDQGFGKDYCGAFHFYFWQYGKWQEIIIDDRLPTERGRIIYGMNRAHPNEFWCSLLEKAYAKLHASYHNIDGGRIVDSLLDMTGGLCEFVPLNQDLSLRELKSILLNCQKMNSIMGAAIFQIRNAATREIKLKTGLYSGHAYSIQKIKEVDTRDGKQVLLHIRNPWGRGEWHGAWSDGSPEWYTLHRDDRAASYRTRDDGEFWISIEDFRKNFDELELCHLTPDALTDEIAVDLHLSQWKVQDYYGSWVPGSTAGGPLRSFTSRKFWTNPQYEISLVGAEKPTTVVISLLEVEAKGRQNSSVSIGFVIFKLGPGRKPHRITAENYYRYSPQLAGTSGAFWPYRERTLRFEMDPAVHVVVPCTYNEDQAGKFYLRIFSEEKTTTIPIVDRLDPPDDEDIPSTPTVTINEDTISDQEFDRLSGDDLRIDAERLHVIFQKIVESGVTRSSTALNLETCRCLIGAANTNSPKGLLAKDEFIKVLGTLRLWRKAFKLIDVNRSGTVDAMELADLFCIIEDLTCQTDLIDFGDSKEAIDGIMMRYGGKRSRVTEEDFIQGFCKTLQLYRVYKELERTKDLSISLGEWIFLGFKD